MGYTHYWHVADNIDNEAWENFCGLVRKAIELDGTPVVDEPTSKPEISAERVVFNGVDEDGHESFFVVKEGESGFNFCKTARKPYDTIVVACCLAGVATGVFASWSSDGDDEEHSDGRELYQRALAVEV